MTVTVTVTSDGSSHELQQTAIVLHLACCNLSVKRIAPRYIVMPRGSTPSQKLTFTSTVTVTVTVTITITVTVTAKVTVTVARSGSQSRAAMLCDWMVALGCWVKQG